MQQALERAEISKLPKALQNRLEKILSDQQTELETLRTNHERYKTDCGESEGLRKRGEDEGLSHSDVTFLVNSPNTQTTSNLFKSHHRILL